MYMATSKLRKAATAAPAAPSIGRTTSASPAALRGVLRDHTPDVAVVKPGPLPDYVLRAMRGEDDL